MIIGISGRIFSGKDTLGAAIQYISTQATHPGWAELSFADFLEQKKNKTLGKQEWKIVKFADKLKEIASMLTGIPREDFEKQEVKESFLGPEWNYFNVYFLHDKGEHEKYGPDFVTRNEAILWEASERRALQWPPRLKTEVREHRMSVREFLQKLGTDGLRNGLHGNIWVNALFADYKPETILRNPHEVIMPNWIITDMRFPNEAQAVIDRGGITVRIDRPDNPVPPGGHISETALNDWNFDMKVVSNGRMDESFLYLAQRVIQRTKHATVNNP